MLCALVYRFDLLKYKLFIHVIIFYYLLHVMFLYSIALSN